MRPALVCLFVGLTGCSSVQKLAPSMARTTPRERPAQLAILDAPVPEPKTTTISIPKSNPTPTIQQIAAQEPASPRTADQLHAEAMAQWAEAPSFTARLRRRESPNGKPRPEELILFKERKDPFGVHMKWIGDEAKGREVLYVRGRFNDKLNIVTAAGDIPFTGAGQRMAFARDSMFVKAANPNHDITEAGMSGYLRDLGQLYAASRNPQSGITVRSLGRVQRPEYQEPLEGVEIRLPSGRDPDVPRGGSRQIFYCTKTKLPVIYLLYDEAGREQNYNCYDLMQLNLKLDEDDFDPDKLWGKRTPVANTSTPKP